jgi:hypothetical protein
MRSTGVSIVHLRRRNLLRRHVSHEILMAASRARWQGTAPSDRPRVRLAAERLGALFESETAESEEIDRFFARSRNTVVFYEDLLENFVLESSRLLEFLGVRPMALDSSRQREMQRPLHESIENYGEVERALAGTVWEPFLIETYGSRSVGRDTTST